ncbi:FAD dependent oxidoreductase [Nautilia profundicola AmH]|uniref:FAD dependent oxidoreductase n=1 Tax=Nautilia profundicola (strain ATCC BAA-1463 / DSM 18972 / AmH) TaxID=598659 RepID=B9L7M4_NAUPA|nr:FAD-dependent oxidoreductase [Nautilia profundicola]ACM93579.1 FAD dependent oxidoreductase [Nautilia profundicola AmH]
MKHFDFIIIGGGIAGLLAAYEFKEYNTLLIDEDGILTSGASAAAGAFLFPKVGFDTAYTRFINNAIVDSLSFYEKVGIDTHKIGVTLLPRDERDIEKFKKYEKEIRLPFEKKYGGFFFKDGGVVFPEEVKEKIKVDYEINQIKNLYKDGEYWCVGEYKTKNVILATGYKEIIDIPYINIRPIWGERIEGRGEINGKWKTYPTSQNGKLKEVLPCHFHKNCSLTEVDGIIKIGATHKRNCYECHENEEEAYELIEKAKEIVDIQNFKISKIIGGFRAASVDYFPVVGKIIDVNESLSMNPKIVKGEMPKFLNFIDGLYIINGMGGRGFSNAYACAKALKEHIINEKELGILDSKRLFIKWARKEGEEYLKEKNVKS